MKNFFSLVVALGLLLPIFANAQTYKTNISAGTGGATSFALDVLKMQEGIKTQNPFSLRLSVGPRNVVSPGFQFKATMFLPAEFLGQELTIGGAALKSGVRDTFELVGLGDKMSFTGILGFTANFPYEQKGMFSAITYGINLGMADVNVPIQIPQGVGLPARLQNNWQDKFAIGGSINIRGGWPIGKKQNGYFMGGYEMTVLGIDGQVSTFGRFSLSYLPDVTVIPVGLNVGFDFQDNTGGVFFGFSGKF